MSSPPPLEIHPKNFQRYPLTQSDFVDADLTLLKIMTDLYDMTESVSSRGLLDLKK